MKKLITVLLIIAALAAIAWFGGRAYLARSVAPYSGTIAANVSAPVEITFDARGVPQIWAKTDADAHFAIGWLHASERLFQMELVRRLSNGELTEVFGDAAFETDVEQRKRGFARRAKADVKNLTPAGRAALQRYVDGVNAYIAHAKLLPPEFVVLNLKPRKWELADCLAVSAYQTWFSHELMDQDGRYQKLIEKIGMPARALANAGHPWSPPTVPRSSSGSSESLGGANTNAEELRGTPRNPRNWFPDLRMSAASNSWAVHASRSASKSALHASDPHLAIDQAPGLWYLAGIHSEEGLDVVGVTYAGGPFVVMGHNRDIAFSFTVASVDIIDYYDDRITGTIAREVIRGKDGNSRTIEVKSGTRGAPIPIRGYDTYVRQNASDPRTAWQGYRSLDETPHAFNPVQGFLASCNNNVVGPDWPYRIPGFYDPYRITRANALLRSKRTRDDMHAMQLDLNSGLAVRWKQLAAENSEVLRDWDGTMSGDSRAATLFAAWWRMLPKAIFEDELGNNWSEGRVLLEEALTTESVVIDDKRTKQVETIHDIAKRAMTDAVPIANDRTWGEASTLTIRHPLARVKVLDWFLNLNRGPYPAPGDNGSLNASFFSYHDESKSFRSHIGPSMRFVLDWSNVDGFTLTGALGQSGNPFSPHYDDFRPMMQRGEEWNVPFTRENVFAKKTSQLTLTP